MNNVVSICIRLGFYGHGGYFRHIFNWIGMVIVGVAQSAWD